MLTPPQAALLEEAEAVGRDLASVSRHSGRVDRELVAALADAGLLPRLYPPEGLSAMDLCLIRQGLARANTEAETAFAMQGLGSYPIYQSARPEVRDRWIPAVSRGEVVPAFALTEPEAGSDAAALSLAAERDGTGWRLSESVDLQPPTPTSTVFAAPPRPASWRRRSWCPATPGPHRVAVDMLSPHPIGHLTFDGVPVLVSTPGGGGRRLRGGDGHLDLFRPRSALPWGWRRRLGSPPSTPAGGVCPTADLRFRPFPSPRRDGDQVNAARLLVYGRRPTRGGPGPAQGAAAMAKLYATETAIRRRRGGEVLGACAEATHPLAGLYRDGGRPGLRHERDPAIIARQLRLDLL